METRPTVFLVECNEKAEMLARTAILKSGINCDVTVAHDGLEACDLLFDGRKVPDILLLELDLPKLNGFEVLSRIRNFEQTKRLTVVMLSHSVDQADVHRCFDLHANSYIHKDEDVECYESRLKLVLYYWIVVNQNANA